MAKNLDFAMESLTSSIYTNKTARKSSEAASVFVKSGVMPTLFESCESVEHYAMVAQESFGQGQELSRYADLALESLSSNVRLIKAIKANVKGAESANISLEAAGVDVAGVVKKVVFAVKAAIQKFITAVGNFIKSVSNWVGSQFAGAQEKTYTAAKTAGIAKLISAAGGETINAIVVKDRAKLFDGSVLPSIEKMADAASAGVELGGATNEDVEGKLKAASQAVASSFAYLIQGHPEVKKYIDSVIGAEKGGVMTKIPSGSVCAKIFVYGSLDAKPAEVKISELGGEGEYAILTKAHAQGFLKAVNAAKKSSAAMGKSLKTADAIMAEVGKPNPEDKVAVKSKMRGLMFSKNIHGFNVSFLLSFYSLYLKERSVLDRALKVMLAKSKKPAAAPAK